MRVGTPAVGLAMIRGIVASFLLLFWAAASGCAGQRLPPPPPEASLPDLPTVRGFEMSDKIRFWGDLEPASAEEQLGLIRRQISGQIFSEGGLPNDGTIDVLALSGGGSDGAYGAGLLNGWSERGDRPEFGLVTGISVGALIAPFAFLGEEYDDALEQLFTGSGTQDLVEFNPVQALFGWALGVADVTPLQLAVDEVVTPAMVRLIAAEHLKGRRLWIGTTFLDAQRPVIWDIGAIATSDSPAKRELIIQVLLASAAIPGAFPPVLIPVEVDDRLYAEMHVDGSVTRQLFVHPSSVELSDKANLDVPGVHFGTIYLVRNTKLAPDYEPVDPSVLRIVERSIFTLTKAAGLGDAQRIEQQALRDGWNLLRTSVPLEFDFPQDGFFDPQYMSALFEVGYERALTGSAWKDVLEAGPASFEHDPGRNQGLRLGATG